MISELVLNFYQYKFLTIIGIIGLEHMNDLDKLSFEMFHEVAVHNIYWLAFAIGRSCTRRYLGFGQWEQHERWFLGRKQ